MNGTERGTGNLENLSLAENAEGAEEINANHDNDSHEGCE